MTDAAEHAALQALDARAITADLAALVRVPSLIGHELAALELLAGLAEQRGLEPLLVQHDLSALRAHPGQPGSEAPRSELWGLTVRRPAAARTGAPRLALCGHVDVVGPGEGAWAREPFSGAVDGGRLHGRGSADMKGGVIAALHALGAVAGAGLACEPELLAVSSEEDGGLGAFAALEQDSAYAGALIPEPTAFDVVCAQAGALTFKGIVHGVSAHAAHRLEGISAIDRYLPIHAALQALEAELNANVADELMAALELPYPVLVGRLQAGSWSSQVPDRLEFEGRAPVLVGQPLAEARAAVQSAVDAACADGPAVELTWEGGSFAPATTAASEPLVQVACDAVRDERGAPARLAGVPWGADMRLFTAKGIPTVMLGTSGIERAHAVDEWVDLGEVAALARTLVRVLCRFGQHQAA